MCASYILPYKVLYVKENFFTRRFKQNNILLSLMIYNIIAINESDSTIIIRDGDNYHTIDLKICSESFKNEHGDSGGTCVGDRNNKGYTTYDLT